MGRGGSVAAQRKDRQTAGKSLDLVCPLEEISNLTTECQLAPPPCPLVGGFKSNLATSCAWDDGAGKKDKATHWASDGGADHHNFQDLEEASKDPSNFMTVHPHRRAHLLYSLAPTTPLTSETFSRPAFPSPSGRCWSIRDALLGYWVTPPA